jgi:hypothetical protein
VERSRHTTRLLRRQTELCRPPPRHSRPRIIRGSRPSVPQESPLSLTRKVGYPAYRFVDRAVHMESVILLYMPLYIGSRNVKLLLIGSCRGSSQGNKCSITYTLHSVDSKPPQRSWPHMIHYRRIFFSYFLVSACMLAVCCLVHRAYAYV